LKLLRGKHWKPVAAECLYLLSDSEGCWQEEGIPFLSASDVDGWVL
jgi:hypothetical protein